MLAENGALGVVAAIIFYVGRKDYMTHKDELLGLLKEAKDDKAILIGITKDITIAITTLTEIVRNSDAYKKTDHNYRETGTDRRRA